MTELDPDIDVQHLLWSFRQNRFRLFQEPQLKPLMAKRVRDLSDHEVDMILETFPYDRRIREALLALRTMAASEPRNRWAALIDGERFYGEYEFVEDIETMARTDLWRLLAKAKERGAKCFWVSCGYPDWDMDRLLTNTYSEYLVENGLTVGEFLEMSDVVSKPEFDLLLNSLLPKRIWDLTDDELRLLYRAFPDNDIVKRTMVNRGLLDWQDAMPLDRTQSG